MDFIFQRRKKSKNKTDTKKNEENELIKNLRKVIGGKGGGERRRRRKGNRTVSRAGLRSKLTEEGDLGQDEEEGITNRSKMSFRYALK